MDPLVVSLALAAAGGALIGLLLSVFGGGGSVLATPLLLYVVGVRDPHVAIGTSAAAVAVNALVGLGAQAKAGRVKWPCALVFGGAGLAGSLVGAHLAKMIDGGQLILWFAGAMALVGLSMLAPKKDEGDPGVRLDAALTRKLAPLGLLVGSAAGFFGIGGGFLIVPGLVLATRMPLRYAVGTSLVVVTALGLTTATSYALSGYVDWQLVGLLSLGGVIGVALGIPLGRRLSGNKRAMELGFAALVIAMGIYVVVRGLG